MTNLWSQPLDGGPATQLTNFKSEIFFSFEWSRDGKLLVLGRGATCSDVVLIIQFPVNVTRFSGQRFDDYDLRGANHYALHYGKASPKKVPN